MNICKTLRQKTSFQFLWCNIVYSTRHTSLYEERCSHTSTAMKHAPDTSHAGAQDWWATRLGWKWQHTLREPHPPNPCRIQKEVQLIACPSARPREVFWLGGFGSGTWRRSNGEGERECPLKYRSDLISPIRALPLIAIFVFSIATVTRCWSYAQRLVRPPTWDTKDLSAISKRNT